MQLFNINDIYATLGVEGIVDSIQTLFKDFWFSMIGTPVLGAILNFFETLLGSGATVV